jgi:hypothetical protein
MTKYQDAYLRMSVAKLMYLNANSSLITGLPSCSTYITGAQTIISQIQAAYVQQEIDKSGNTATKKVLRTTVVTLSNDIVHRMVAYCTNVNNLNLLQIINYSKSDFRKACENNLVSMCQVIRDTANANLAALTPYGVTVAMITALQTAITSFNNSIAKLRVDITDSSEATKLMADLYKSLKTHWKKIDILVAILQTSNVSFYNEYKKLSKVIITGRGYLDLKVMTINAETELPEASVKLILKPTKDIAKSASNMNEYVAKKTLTAGKCYYKNLSNGTYIIKASKPGFKDVEMTVNVVKSEKTVVYVRMEKA